MPHQDKPAGVPWGDMGRADFDQRKLAKGYHPAPADQAGLFYLPAPERAPRPAEPTAQLDGQDDLFGGTP